MKRCFLLMLIGFLMLFCGCAAHDAVGSKLAGMDESEKWNWMIDRLENADSFEWDTTSQTSSQYEGVESVNIMHSNNKYITEPLITWTRLETGTGDGQPYVIEIFDEEKNGTLIHSMRSGNAEKDVGFLTPWDTNSLTSEEKDLFIDVLARGFSDLAYLLRRNADSFIPGSDQLDGITCTRYDGEIKQETVLDYYEQYGRDRWVRMRMLEKKEGMLREDLKNEILNAVNTPPFELTSGFNEILFSDDPAPVSIWLNDADGSIKCIRIDLTAAMIGHTKLMEMDHVDQVTIIERYTEHQNIVFDKIKTFAKPE